ncbi:MAG: glycosyltransferase, partial [Thermoplasmata archaeon]
VLLSTDSYYQNIDGGAVARRNLAIRLMRKGHEVAVAAPGFKPRNYEEEIDGIKIFRVSGRTLPVYTDYKFCVYPVREVRSIIDTFKPDVIDINTPYQIGMAALSYAKKKGIPAIGTVHVQPENMLMSVGKAKFLHRLFEKWAWVFITRFFNRCDYVTSPTPTAIKMLKDNGLTARAMAISSGTNLEVFSPENDGEYLRKKFSIPHKPVVLYTGRISGEKRLDVLIEAIPLILQHMDAHFVICGAGRDKGSIEAMVSRLGLSDHVTFTGFLPDEEFPDVYAVADLFVITSESELQSIVLLEALASGLPAIAASKDALPELVINPENGFLFEPGNSRDLAEKIVEILASEELRARMGKRSLEIVQEHSVEATAVKFESLYKTVIDNFNTWRGH